MVGSRGQTAVKAYLQAYFGLNILVLVYEGGPSTMSNRGQDLFASLIRPQHTGFSVRGWSVERLNRGVVVEEPVYFVTRQGCQGPLWP